MEQRKLTRFEFDHDIPVFNVEYGRLIGRLENLTLEGMMLSSESPLVVGQEYHLSLSLGTVVAGRSTVRCRVRSMWSGENMWREAESTKRYFTGFNITSISKAELNSLDVLITTLGHPSGQTKTQMSNL